ncbi:hypothetical protein HK104_008347 [Borealophlyctis nickersoniae]|nr:hypothetical protein HK104_008347 [Borealophlyctis nickersoniae]
MCVESALPLLFGIPITKSVLNRIIAHSSFYRSTEHLDVDSILTGFHRYSTRLHKRSAYQTTVSKLHSLIYRLWDDFTDSMASREQPAPFTATAAVLTKPPETVLVFLRQWSVDNQEIHFEMGIFDSHPRPQLNIPSAHVIKFSTISALIAHLHGLFPSFDATSATDISPYEAELLNTIQSDVFVLTPAAPLPTVLDELLFQKEVEVLQLKQDVKRAREDTETIRRDFMTSMGELAQERSRVREMEKSVKEMQLERDERMARELDAELRADFGRSREASGDGGLRPVPNYRRQKSGLFSSILG